MSKFNSTFLARGEAEESVPNTDSTFAPPHRSAIIDDNLRLVELEMENSRLHRLVAELLLKNQQLRKQDQTQS